MGDDQQQGMAGQGNAGGYADNDDVGAIAGREGDVGVTPSSSQGGPGATTTAGTRGAGGGTRGEGLIPSGTDATGGMSDTTTDYVDGEIRGG